MVLPVGVTRLGSFRGDKGDPGGAGPAGPTGSLAFAEAVRVPFGTAPSVVMIGPANNRGARFSIPDGAPGVNAVPTDEAVAANVANKASATGAAVDAAVITSQGPARSTAPRYLDAYVNYFKTPAMVWVPGQAIVGTTLAAPAATGATVLSLASGTGILPGMTLVTDQGTTAEQQFRVVSVAGADATVTPAVAGALASGAAIGPWWEDPIHPVATIGGVSYGYWLANAKDATGAFAIRNVPAGRPVVVLGDSWVGRFFTRFASALAERLPGVTAVNAGVPGNTSAMMIARFATDVPTNASYVLINEPGVNDAPTVSLDQQTENLRILVDMIRGIGAIPVFSGPVPLVNNQDQAKAQADAFRAQLANPIAYPAVTPEQLRRQIAPMVRPEVFSLGIGEGALVKRTTGTHNTATGYLALGELTTGVQNVGLGYRALAKLAAGNQNTAIGSNALAENTATGNTAIGSRALTANTTGGNATAVGKDALAAQTTGADNTAIGASALTLNTTGANNAAAGSGALAKNTTGNQNTAFGAFSLAAMTVNAGSTAIGTYALLAATGAGNIGIGRGAMQSLTTGATNTAIGTDAGQSPAGVVGNASTTASRQTLIGHQAGQGSATQVDSITAIGARALVSGTRSIALGADTSVVEADQAGIGPRSFYAQNVAAEPATPAAGGVLFMQAGALKYKGSAGTVTTLAAA
ncbi:GDSL-type esterase/lipase family protein [Microbacterium sp. 22303]|uniref:SGNH/GDSL hydrolase family protein n=1 Tax=Microbacterium sp. 22303 TaxID=3453905 RepID=UPI003F84659A